MGCGLSLCTCLEGEKVPPYSKGEFLYLPGEIGWSPGKRIVVACNLITYKPTLPPMDWCVCVWLCMNPHPPQNFKEREFLGYIVNRTKEQTNNGKNNCSHPQGKRGIKLSVCQGSPYFCVCGDLYHLSTLKKWPFMRPPFVQTWIHIIYMGECTKKMCVV